MPGKARSAGSCGGPGEAEHEEPGGEADARREQPAQPGRTPPARAKEPEPDHDHQPHQQRRAAAGSTKCPCISTCQVAAHPAVDEEPKPPPRAGKGWRGTAHESTDPPPLDPGRPRGGPRQET